MGIPKIDIASLSAEERMDLLEQIWDSFVDDPESLPVTAALRSELRRRITSLTRSGETGKPWAEVREGIRRNRLGKQ